MSRLVLSEDALLALIAQAKAAGNAALVAELESTLKNAKRLKQPNSIETLTEAAEAAKEGVLTIRKESVREAAKLLLQFAKDADAELQAKIVAVFAKAMRTADAEQ